MNTNSEPTGKKPSSPDCTEVEWVTKTSRFGFQYRQKIPREQPIAVPPVPVDPLFTTAQVSVILRVSIETLKKWRRRSGKGPGFLRYPDGTIRYRLSVITKFLNNCTVER